MRVRWCGIGWPMDLIAMMDRVCLSVFRDECCYGGSVAHDERHTHRW